MAAIFVFLARPLILRLLAIPVAVSFLCISQAIQVRISYQGTLLETRDQKLSFGTKIYGISFIIDGDISYSKKNARLFARPCTFLFKVTQLTWPPALIPDPDARGRVLL